MIIKEVNEGKKIDYEVDGNRIYFGNDELMLNLSRYERDDDVFINICMDGDYILTSSLSKSFVANILIPAREYEDEEKTIPVPFDMSKVTLMLWALPVDEEV